MIDTTPVNHLNSNPTERVVMYVYHGTPLHTQRVADEECRCQSGGASSELGSLLNEQGIATDPVDRCVLLTTAALGLNPDEHRVFIYAVNADGQIRIGQDGGARPNKPRITKHETLWTNDNVKAAGEIQFDQGIVVDVNDKSGSYGTGGQLEQSPTFGPTVLLALQGAGCIVDPFVVRKLHERG